MTMGRLMWRFVLVYSVLMVLVGLALHWLDVRGTAGLNIGVLAGTVFWACASFAQCSGRWFEPGEQATVVLGFAAINLLLQAGFGLLALAGQPFVWQALLIGLALVGVLHTLLIWAFVRVTRLALSRNGTPRSGLQAPTPDVGRD